MASPYIVNTCNPITKIKLNKFDYYAKKISLFKAFIRYFAFYFRPKDKTYRVRSQLKPQLLPCKTA